MMEPKRAGIKNGFSLLEISIVLVIIAIVAGGSMVIFSASLEGRQWKETQTKLKAIQKALYDYRIAYNRIPCPGDITLAPTTANFGVEAAVPGTCTGGTPAANFSKTNVRAGLVPVKTLRLPDDYAYDGWGRRILYSVDKRYTLNITTIGTGVGVKLLDAAGSTKTNCSVYALLSHGANGHGAYPRNGGSTRISSSSTNSDELENCDCNSSGVSGTFNTSFVQKMPTRDSATATRTNDFDDIVVSANPFNLNLFGNVSCQAVSLFSDDFSSGSLGSAWSTYGGTWSQAGGVLSQTSTATGDPRKAMVIDQTYPADVVITAKVRVDAWVDGDGARAGIGLYTNTGNGRSYNIAFHNNHSTVQFLNDGILWGNSYSFSWSNGVWYWFKLKMESGVLYAKVWQDGDSEPATWPYQQSGWTTLVSTGAPALNGGSSAVSYATVSFDDVSVSEP